VQNNFYFTGNFSNIYKKPSIKSEVTSQILHGEKFKILIKNKKDASDNIFLLRIMEDGLVLLMRIF